MPKFLNHDGISHGIFNADYTGATGPHVAWERFLVNNNTLLHLLVDRMRADWESFIPKMRKAWGQSSLEAQSL